MENEMKHTPGPWRLNEKFTTVSSETEHIASVDTLANARLIAAAPEMLEALKGMEDMFRRHIEGREGPDDAAQLWDAAQAAIAKAEGK